MWRLTSSFGTRSVPKNAQTAVPLMSSCVGPSPPVTTVTSAESHAVRSAPSTASIASPTVDMHAMSTPIALRRSAMNAWFVLITCPISSSSPIVSMCAFNSSPSVHEQRPEKQDSPRPGIRVDPGHDIVKA